MTTLAPPLPIPPPAQLGLPATPFFGRSLAEYTQFFAIDPPSLRGRDVLDVAAGPSSFVAEACVRRIDAVAVDPLYGSPLEALAARVEADYSRVLVRARARPSLARLGASGFRTFAAAEADRRAAAQRFLDDYAAHYLHGRYVGAALPRLPFFDGTFDLVLCAHLLFGSADGFDFEWHVAACRELVRVSAGEARIHPIGGPDGKAYPGLARLRRELRALEVTSELVTTGHESAAGGSAMLVLRKGTP